MARCEHCLLELSDGESVRSEDGKTFCCEGCRAVHSFIRGEGLASFYRRRDRVPPAEERRGRVEAPETGPFEEMAREVDGLGEIDLYVDGIRCASCVWLVEKVLQKTAGVAWARVNYATHKARIRWRPGETSLGRILARIAATGYAPKPYSESERVLARRAESRDLLVRFGTAAFLSSQLMLYSTALYAGYFQGMDPRTRRIFELIALFLTAPVLFYAGGPLFRSTAAGLRRLRFNMDSLIVLGSMSAFLYSLYGLARGGEVYFDTAAMIVTLILLGRYLESRARGKASEAVEKLADLSPAKAVRVSLDARGAVASRETVEASSLRPGHLVEARPGEKYAADGVVIRGESAADESLLTGESLPVPKAAGAEVIGGALNGYGTLVFEVTKTGKESVLSRIIAAVEEAQAARPSIQGLADRFVGVFVPLILALALLTVLAHLRLGSGLERSLLTGISVLVIACPCSLGLATPLAVLVYTGLASSRGILIKGGQTAEFAAAVTRVVFDKTGTVTRGSMALREIVTLDPSLSREHCLGLAASLEAPSEHALGAALVTAAGGRTPFDVTDFRALPGEGVAGRIEGREVILGSRALLEKRGFGFPDHGNGPAAPAGEDEGFTRVFMGWEGKVRALFALNDGLRGEARDAVAALRSQGVKAFLLSGDGAEATSAVARRTGMEEFEAGARPERKREAVAAMQAAGETVMVVGDGINDAPALTEALVGVAVGRGTDIAMESADVVLVRHDLRLIPWFLALSRGAFRIIGQNVFWAIFYNVIAIPLAMAGFLHPIVAAAAMASSSLFVVVNSLRIRALGGERG